MVDAVSMQTSFIQTVAAEKVSQVEIHQGDTNQQAFAAELAKQDQKRVHDVQKTAKEEAEEKIDPHEERKQDPRQQKQQAQDQENLSDDDDSYAADGEEHLIDITV